MTNEHIGICIYEKGRFELRETDNAIIDLKGDFPPIMIASNTVDDGSEPQYADRRGVLHLLNELSDNNPNEEKHWYLKEMLNKAWTQYHEQKDENEQLKFQLQNTSDQRDEFHRGARENANRVGKLEKENEQLRHDATILIQSNQDYRKENEQLKEQLMDCEKFRHTVFQEISKEMNKHD